MQYFLLLYFFFRSFSAETFTIGFVGFQTFILLNFADEFEFAIENKGMRVPSLFA